jgi:serine/threonine protein phosphatase PrpC
VVESLRESLAGGSATEDACEVLRVAVEHANKRVIAAAREGNRHGMGATLAAVLIKGGHAFTAEVGDSRIYLHRGTSCELISKDQTYVQVLLDQGLLTPETVKSSRAKNVVLQAIGKAPRLAVAQRKLALRRGDRLLLCSDGLTAHFEQQEIGEILGGAPLEDAVRDLVAKTNERGGKDNTTVLVLGIGNSAPPPGAGERVADTLTSIREFAVSDGEE